jgi:hypothetical protein
MALRAQEPERSQPPPSNQNGSNSTNQDKDQDTSSGSQNSTNQDANQQEPLPDHPETSTLDTSQGMGQSNRIVPLRWGHLSNLSVESFYAYDSNLNFSANNPRPADEEATRLIADYSIGSERLGLDVQYRPFLAISKDRQRYNFAASYLNFHVFRRLSARWTFSFHDTFQYEPDVALFINPTITPNFSTGQIIQASLLGNGLTELRNNDFSSATYHLARHDNISFHGQYNYIDQRNNPDIGPFVSNVVFFRTETSAGGGAGWTHSFSADHEFGISYNYDLQLLGGLTGQAQYHSIIGRYKQKIRPTILLELSLGPSLQIPGNNLRERKTLVGHALLLRTFRESSIGLQYVRGYDYVGVITDSYHDRYDAVYARNFGRTWGYAVGAAYIQTHATGSSLRDSVIEGRTVWGRVSYYLTPHWTIFTSLTNSVFAGGPTPYASRYFFMVGAKWSYGGDKDLRHQ